MSEKQSIMIIEDEPGIADTVTYALAREGFEPVWAATGAEGMARLVRGGIDLVILDIGLPDISGFDLAGTIRKRSDVPLLMLTARSDEIDRVLGLELGADDYIVKPFSPRELVARVRALLRRSRSETEPQRSHVAYGPLEIDLAGHKVFVDGEEIELTASEYKLLTTLTRYPGRVYSRMELVEKVLGYDFEGYERAIDSHVKNLRAKLADDPKEPRFIHTVFGVGYRFDPPQAAS